MWAHGMRLELDLKLGIVIITDIELIASNYYSTHTLLRICH